MNFFRLLFRSWFGQRLPTSAGELAVPGIERPVTIRRDAWGVPYVEAETDADAWFGLGFCHGQDRTFQLETLLRVVRGTLSELVGPPGLAVDRLSRRIGFARAAQEQLAVLDTDMREMLDAYVAGVAAGATVGLPRPPHELALLRRAPTPWTTADALATLKLQSFGLAANWDSELIRLKILQEDGPEALAALDPVYADWLPVVSPVGALAGVARDRLAEDLAALCAVVQPGGGSNNWAIAGSRTATGRPLLANDPHLATMVPPPWYLAHVRTPRWAVAGASFVGGPTFPAGHNGFAAWGLTAGLADNTDLFLEEIGPDGRSVRQGEAFVPCPVRRETIAVRGGESVTEEVLLTPRGPVIGPALQNSSAAVSLRATWLDPLPVRGLLALYRAGSFEEFREYFRHWPALSANMVYADTKGTIGWHLAGRVPRRRKGWGVLPMAGSDPEAGWHAEPVPFEEMPQLVNPPSGWLATANGRPVPEGEGPFLGADWADGYRMARIVEVLAQRRDWDIAGSQTLQMDRLAIPWREMREIVLAVPGHDADLEQARRLLADWDGVVSAESPAASVYELFVAELICRMAMSKAPRSHPWILGEGFTRLLPYTLFAVRRMAHVVRLLRCQPPGWFARSWPHEIADVLRTVIRRLRTERGSNVSRWAWGRVRPLTLRHALGERWPLGHVFNLGPMPWGGDPSTPHQAAVLPAMPTKSPAFVATMRLVIDVGAWENSRFVIPGGQSGNPFSPHYADQLPLWQRGDGIPIAWSEEAVRQASRQTLRLTPIPTEHAGRV